MFPVVSQLMGAKEKIINFLEKKIRTDIRYVYKGFFWYGIGHFVSTLAGVATAVAFANLLAPETYGNFKYILSILPFLDMSTLKRMDQSLTISVAKGFEGDTVGALKTKMKWGILGSLAGLGLSFYYYASGNHQLGLLVLIMAIFVPFFNSPLIYLDFLAGRKNFKALSLIGSSVSVVYSISIIIFVFLSKDLVLILLAYFITNAIIRFGAFLFVIKKYPPNKIKEEGGQTLKYGKKLSILEIINVTSSSLDNILVFHYLGAIELAAYAFIKKVPENIKLLPRYITQLSVPKFSQQDIGDPFIKKELVRKTWFFVAGTAAVVFIYILLAPFIFNLLFAPYKEYVFYSQIYALSFAFNFGGLFLNFVETNRKAREVLSLHLVTSIFTIVVVFASLKFYGLLGLVAGYSAIRFVSSLVRYAYFKRATR